MSATPHLQLGLQCSLLHSCHQSLLMWSVPLILHGLFSSSMLYFQGCQCCICGSVRSSQKIGNTMILLNNFDESYRSAYQACFTSFLRLSSSIFLASAALAFSCYTRLRSAYYQSSLALTKSRSYLTSS